jgi:hypothetical protein
MFHCESNFFETISSCFICFRKSVYSPLITSPCSGHGIWTDIGGVDVKCKFFRLVVGSPADRAGLR